MRSSVVLCLAVSFSMFGFGLSLQCYSCPGGSSSSREVKQECDQAEDSCIKLPSGGKTYTKCMRYADCDVKTLAVLLTLPDFTFSCCQSNLCNGKEKSLFQKIKEFFS